MWAKKKNCCMSTCEAMLGGELWPKTKINKWLIVTLSGLDVWDTLLEATILVSFIRPKRLQTENLSDNLWLKNIPCVCLEQRCSWPVRGARKDFLFCSRTELYQNYDSRPFVPLCNQDEAEAEEYAERCIILITRNLKMTALLKERQNIPKTHVPV